MGITGTEVAKDAAGMVLTDDNFATIVKAVKNGRNVYANIKRAIQFLLSGNTAGILTVLYASLMGLPVPFAAVHLLFINLLTDSLPAIALGMEPHTNEVMSEKPRPRNEGILTKPFLYSVGVEGLVIAAATVTAFYLGLNAGGAAAGQTMAFSTLCLSRLFHGFSCKSQHPVLLTRHFWNNRALLGAFTIGALLLGLVLLVPALEPLFAHGNRILPGWRSSFSGCMMRTREYLFLTNNSGYTPRELNQSWPAWALMCRRSTSIPVHWPPPPSCGSRHRAAPCLPSARRDCSTPSMTQASP